MGFFSTVLGFFGFGWGITLILVIGSTYKSSPSPPTSREVISIWDSTESMFKSHIDAGKVPQKEDLIKPGEIAKSLEVALLQALLASIFEILME
ncbi:uncharacterized protein LOC121984375 isoform X3 [Zingiber officinale]|uniref:uncharacterized protein LOC121980466 isoform X3 n=1 Tax=Zingiber officinale TaxID=94328 RepID=UPI001C4AFE66|nr:uncharacterized protein LOC121980466 isoform X3 [Zingiber officinale]XP_042393213.1 uncharacterized protein LOC121984375 isoform X3 [Zingiber officinale]